jgi:hypothetical protein
MQSLLEEKERNKEANGNDEKNEEDVHDEVQQKLCSLLEAVDIICTL